MYNVKQLGQVFTSQSIVSEMLALRKNQGNVLEPACGDGAFLKHLKNYVGIEIDKKFSLPNVLNMDFFDFSVENKFDTIIGNPPYVRFQDIPKATKNKLDFRFFDKRSNLYLFFIEKCIRHLKNNGELIFITPRDFLKSTSSITLNQFMYENGTITDIIDLGDQKVFGDYTPNCIIWRFEKDNFSRKTNTCKNFILSSGQLLFTDNIYPVKFSEIFFVKVGAVSGADHIFANEKYGNCDFVCSYTSKTGKIKKMIFENKISFLKKHKEFLLQRKIKRFNENNWWEWGRSHYKSGEKRIYVNGKTRNSQPFFTHKSNFYDGSVLAIFPLNQGLDINELREQLNKVNWLELGFVCDGRFLFTQKSLENCILPENFSRYINYPDSKVLSYDFLHDDKIQSLYKHKPTIRSRKKFMDLLKVSSKSIALKKKYGEK